MSFMTQSNKWFLIAFEAICGSFEFSEAKDFKGLLRISERLFAFCLKVFRTPLLVQDLLKVLRNHFQRPSEKIERVWE